MNLGIDIGYSHTKIVSISNHGKHDVFPSVTCAPVSSMMNLDGARMSLIHHGDTSLLTGDCAVIHGGQRTEDPDWVLGNKWLSLLYTAIGRTQKTHTHGVLVTGLPVADYARLRVALRTNLLQHHAFDYNGKPYAYRCLDVRVVPQAWGPILSLIFDKNGDKVQDLTNERIAVIDIGGKTVNLLSVDGLMDIPTETRGLELGAWNVIKEVRNFFNREHPGLNRMSDHQIVKAVAVGFINVPGGKRVTLRTVITPVVERMGEQIVELSQQYWGRGALTHQRVLVTGGGAYLWGKHIKKAFPHATVVNSPEFGNAQGYANFAAWVWRGARKDE